MNPAPPRSASLLLYPALLLLVPVIIASGFAIGARELKSKSDTLGYDAVDAIATAIETTRGHPPRERTHYFVSYRFEPEGHPPFERKKRVSVSYYNRVRAALMHNERTIPIRYSYLSPDLHEIEIGSLLRKSRYGFLMSAIFAALSLVPLSILVRRALRLHETIE